MLLAALMVAPAFTRSAPAANAAQAQYGPALDKGGGGGQNGGGQNKGGGSNQGNGAGASQGHGNGNGQGAGQGNGNGQGNGAGQGAGNGNGQGAGNGNGNGQGQSQGQGAGNGNGGGQSTSHGRVTKTADRANAAPGDVINYTITLRNSGGAGNVTLTDNMPQHTSFVSASGACHVVGGDGKKLSCVVPIGANGVATVQVSLRVAPDAPCNSVLTNVAHVNGWGSAQAQTRVLCTTGTATPAVTGTAGPSATATTTAAATATTTQTPAATATTTATRPPAPTATPTRTATPAATATRTATPGIGTPSATTTATATATATATGTPTVPPPPTVTPSAQAGSLVAGRQDTPWWALAGTVLLLIGVGAAFAAKGLRGAP